MKKSESKPQKSDAFSEFSALLARSTSLQTKYVVISEKGDD